MGTTKWFSTKTPGIRYRKHKTRKHGSAGFDKYFAIRYQRAGKRKEEGLGWASEGWTEKKAADKLARIREAIRTGQGPQSLKESRDLARKKREAEAEREKARQLANLTFSDFFNKTYLPIAKQDKKKRSWKTEVSWFTNWIEPVIGKMPLADIAPFHIEKIKRKMMKAEKASRSIQYCLATIRQVFNVASRQGIFKGVNPAIDVKIKLNDNRRQRFLTPAEADSLLDELSKRSGQLHDMSLLSLHCGLRAGEVFSLSWDCINFDEEKFFIKDAKGGKSRYAFMTSDVKKMLMIRWKGENTGLIFPNRKGKRIDEISATFGRAVDKLGLNDGVADRREKVTFHTLRHTFASWLVQEGEPLYTVAKLMGHSTIAMTERYSHLAPDNIKAAVGRIEAKLNAKTQTEGKIIPLKTDAV